MSPRSSEAYGSLTVRRIIRATPWQLFAAWTQPEQLRKWWGPSEVHCPVAEVDLQVGGRFRLANQFENGNMLWISGEFQVIEPPVKLVYTWRTEPGPATEERVTVRFESRGPQETEVVVVHERIADPDIQRGHEHGWNGCLDGLAEHVARPHTGR